MRIILDSGTRRIESKIMRIAIVRLSALGDIIQSMIVVQFIRKHFSEITIDWIVDKKFFEIVRLNNSIDNVQEIRLSEIKKSRNIFHLIKHFTELRKIPRYDLVIDTQGLLKSAIISKLIPSKETIGFDRRSAREPLASFFYSKSFKIPYDHNVVERYCALVSKALNIEILKKDIHEKTAIFQTSNYPVNNKPIVSIIVGASFESKIYPVERYQFLLDNLDAKFICLWGNKYEYNLAKKLLEMSPKVSIAEKTSMAELLKIISKSNLVIGGDTGPTHLAWALNIPSITLFGPTLGSRNMFETDKNLKLESDSEVDPYKIDKDDLSISQIEPKTILSSAKRLLEG